MTLETLEAYIPEQQRDEMEFYPWKISNKDMQVLENYENMLESFTTSALGACVKIPEGFDATDERIVRHFTYEYFKSDLPIAAQDYLHQKFSIYVIKSEATEG